MADMLKLHFFDSRSVEMMEDFRRELQPPLKHRANPVLVPDHPLEGGRASLYGSVIRRPDDALWQMWYTVWPPEGGIALAYAESDDGITWRRPNPEGCGHLVLRGEPHGSTVIYDEGETRPGWRYKLLAGAAPSHRISAFHSADGIAWRPAAQNPVIGSHPDCPMSLHRAPDGRYVLYCRPEFADRRVSRRESWDFVHWSEPRIVIDQDAADSPQLQFYGLGAVPYGPYEIGTLWLYHTDPDDLGFYKMSGRQQPEVAYARSGYAWHRASAGDPWIALGGEGTWDWGAIQPASAPVLLGDEIRFYYAGSRVRHGVQHYQGDLPRCGIGFASMAPDRFVALVAGRDGRLLTRPFWTETPRFFVNAEVSTGGSIRVGLCDVEGQPLPGFGVTQCKPLTGDSTRHELHWLGAPDRSQLVQRDIRFRVEASNARLFTLAAGSEEQLSTYWRFRIPDFLAQDDRVASGMLPD